MRRINYLLLPFIALFLLFSCSENNLVLNDKLQNSNVSVLTDGEKDALIYAFKENHTIGVDVAQQKAEEAMSLLTKAGKIDLKSTRARPQITKIQIATNSKSLTRSAANSEFGVAIPDTIAYLFGFGEGEGFVMIAADERIEESVLACTEIGEIPDEIIDNEPMGFFLDNAGEYIVKQLETAQQKKDSLINSALEKLKIEMPEEFAKLEEGDIKTKSLSSILNFEIITRTTATPWQTINSKGYYIPVEWGQQVPYWNYVKDKKSCGTVRTGCVATAVAQIMAYWKYPNVIDGVIFDWDGLTNKTYIDAYNSKDANLRNQVAHLMKAIGENSGMDYDCGSSGTKTYKGRNYMNKLGYSGGSESKYNFNTVMTSLDAACPVLARGDRTFKYVKIFGKKIGYTKNGHAWVIDGYVRKSRIVNQEIIFRNKKTGKVLKSEKRHLLNIVLLFTIIGAGMVLIMVGLQKVVLIRITGRCLTQEQQNQIVMNTTLMQVLPVTISIIIKFILIWYLITN